MSELKFENRKKVGYVVVKDLTRISRKLENVMRFKQQVSDLGLELVTGSETPKYPATELLMAITSVYGQRDISQDMYLRHRKKVNNRMLERVKQGYSVHRPPVGYSHTTTRGLYKQNNTASALRLFCKSFVDGDMTFDEFNRSVSQIYSETKLLGRSKLLRLFSNPYYGGFVGHAGELFIGLHEPLFSTEQQERLKRLLG